MLEAAGAALSLARPQLSLSIYLSLSLYFFCLSLFLFFSLLLFIPNRDITNENLL